MSEGFVVNPYDFIPFGNGPERRPLEDHSADSLHSGWFDVTLRIKTPLIIPDASHFTTEKVSVRKGEKERMEQHRHYRFFRRPDGTLSIPGSTLRGLIRSVYEAATDSCLPFLPKEPDHPISQRTPLYAAFKKRGLLRYDPQEGNWSLYSTFVTRIKTNGKAVESGTFQGFHNGDHVRFSAWADKTVQLGKGDQEGWLQFNIPVDLENNYNVAILQEKELVYQETGDSGNARGVSMERSLRTAIYDTIQNSKKFDRTTTQTDLMNRLDKAKASGDAIPCYYFTVKREGETLVYLSGAAAGRVRQRRKWADIMGQHCPCESLEALCPACALFGTVNGGGTVGRLCFWDAIPGADCTEPTEKTLPILSTPNPSAFEFYLRKPDPEASYWNFDYYGVKTTRNYESDGETHSFSFTDYRDLPAATPRGRKMYWHGDIQTSSVKSKLNSTMEAVEKGSFTFRVSFDRITDRQLGDLLWCVCLGENKEKSKYLHKLGHGKPVGFGSVKLYVTDLVFRTIDPENGFAVRMEHLDPADYLDSQDRASDCKTEQVEAIRRMVDRYAAKGEEIAYPTGWDNKGRKTIYAWFGANRVNAEDVLTLPEPTASTLTLPSPRGKHPDRGNKPKGNKNLSELRNRNRIPFGTVLHGVKVLNVSKGNIFFKLPDSTENGHCYSKTGKHFYRGQAVNIRVLRYCETYHTYDVEVLPT